MGERPSVEAKNNTPSKRKGLKGRLNQRPRSPKSIKVDEIKPLALNNRPMQKAGLQHQHVSLVAHPSGCRLARISGKPIGIPIVDP